MPDTETLSAPEHKVLSVKLSELSISDHNPRSETEADEDIAALAISIGAIGLIQPLVVIKRGGRFEVIDGRRRFLALQHLASENAIASDSGVTVMHVTQKHLAAGLAANIQRRAMTPVEVFKAVTALSKTLKTAERIASVLGIEPRTVRQYQALGALPQPFLDALEAGQVHFDMAKMLCQIEDADRRAGFIDQALEGELQTWQLRSMLKADKRRSDEHLPQFLTEAAYIAAGGKVEGDLFDDFTFWVTGEAVDRAFNEATIEVVAVLSAQGLLGVEVTLETERDPGTVYLHDFIGIDEEGDLEAFEEHWHALETAVQDTWRAHLDTSTSESRQAYIEAVCALEAFELAAVSEDVRKTLTAKVSFATKLYVSYAIATDKEVEERAEATSNAASGESSEVEKAEIKVGERYLHPSARLAQRLSEIRTRVFAKDLLGHPDIALALLIAQLSGQLRVRCRGASPLKVSGTVFSAGIGNTMVSEDESWSEIGENVKEMLTPPEDVELIEHILGMSPDDRSTCLTFLIASFIDLSEPKQAYMGKPDLAFAGAIAERIGADPAKHWTPDSETLTGFTKGALIDIATANDCEMDPNAKKMTLVSKVEAITADNGWVHPEVQLTADHTE